MANVILRVKREDGSWAEIPALVGPEGPQGVSIDDIVLKSQEGGVSTYLILLSDGSEKTFQVTDGAIITDVSLISTDVLIDTYKISISDGSFFNFKVTNGRGIKSIAKTSTDVLSDTYTISYNDNTSSTFKVTNGRSITKIVKSSTDVLTDTYTISYNDNTTSTYTITNGRGIDYIEKDETIGLSDRYTIHYNDGSTSYYHVVNGEAGPAGSIGNRIYLSGLVDKVNDEEGYGRVKELKESDFDLSKFIVVGSPVISADGVASGFSTSNYLTIPSVDLSKPFKFSGTFTTGADIYHSQAVFGGTFESTQFFILGVHSDGYPVIYYPRTAGDSWIKLSRIVSANTTYHYTLTFDGTNLTFNLTDGASYNLTITPTNFNASGLGVIPTLYIGRNASGTYIMQPDAIIDLSKFSITVDGKEVFSGNPTSLDTIKANNYTVAGSPTITDDGVYQQNATSDRILGATIGQTFTQSVKVGGRYTVKLDSKTEQLMDLVSFGSNNILLYDGIVKSGDDWYVVVSNGTSVAKTLVEIPLKDGDIIDTELIIDRTNMTLYAKLNESVTYTATVASLGTGIINKYQLSMSARSWSGKVDLNTIHVYIDGNLVYQPCLKIPYTKAKTGSKIVDISYKLRVEDCYNQYGAGNYYLFSSATEQFALPMPDIYGLIEYLDSKIVTLDNKKVNRAGDIMTGALTIRGPEHPQLSIYRTNPANDTPSEEKAAQLLFLGSDDKWIGAVQNVNYAGSATVDGVTTNYPVNVTGLESRTLQNNGTSYLQEGLWVATDSQGNAWTYAPHPANKLDNSNKLATTNWVRNHCCTTPATTKSTASLDAPCYVIENYVNGTSWYRCFSDFWVEQGNRESSNRNVNLPKPFSGTNYTVVAVLANVVNSSSDAAGYAQTGGYTTTYFYMRARTYDGLNFNDIIGWCAFGY